MKTCAVAAWAGTGQRDPARGTVRSHSDHPDHLILAVIMVIKVLLITLITGHHQRRYTTNPRSIDTIFVPTIVRDLLVPHASNYTVH